MSTIAMEITARGVLEILKKLVPVVSREIRLAWGVKDELKKLEATLEMILAVIEDAEAKQVTEKAVRLWLRRLKDVAYDAEDVMDEYSYEMLRRSEKWNNLTYKGRDFFSNANPLVFSFKMSKKIKKINKRLDVITKDMKIFQLQPTHASNSTFHHGESSEQWSRQTESYTNESEIMGREDDKKKIIDMLTNVTSSTSSSNNNQEKVSVVSIVGMGGLGKTTLAQLVYNDEFVKEQFKLRMWVYVSQHFDVKRLLTEIMESITGSKFDTLSNFDVLGRKVREQLTGKKYLLVLDDLWNKNNEQWDSLHSPLNVGAKGSKILITTRNTEVADAVKGDIPPYKLKSLQHDECWFVIQKKAFSPGGARKTAKMTTIGLEIAKKCCGLPLAAKFLGSTLRSRNTEAEWLAILEDDKWSTSENQSSVMPILKLSYDNLSPQLKQCFSYLCIFPKGSYIDKVTLVQMWIAEGFLDTCNVGNGKSVEDVGLEWLESLVWNSFLDVVEDAWFSGDRERCKMHDLVHDLAQAVSGDQELVCLKASEFKNTSEIRRLQLILDADLSSTFLKSLLGDEKKLRTLFIPKGFNKLPDISLVNKHLRVLHVGPSPECLGLPELPSLSFKLTNLRYLHLTGLDLSEVVNDSSNISKLYNLETLVLKHMRGSIVNILRNNQSLKKLRHLSISWIDMEELPDSVTSLPNLHTLDLQWCNLKSLPESATGLKNLRFLDISFNSIEKLPGFITNLGSLQILNVKSCENLKSLPESATGLKNLRFLDLSDNPIEKLPGFIVNLSNLQILKVNNCENLKYLPEYVKGLDNLKIFDFRNCKSLEKLPEDFGALTQLRKLDLKGTGIEVLPESCANLINLEEVSLYGCDLPKEVSNWTKVRSFDRRFEETPVGFGKLVSLESLVYLVKEQLGNGTDCNDGIEELGNLNSLTRLIIFDLQNVKNPMDAERANLKGKQSLSELALLWYVPEDMWDRDSCNFSCNFQVIEALQPHSGLRKLQIESFPGCDLPMWMCVPSSIGQLQHLTTLDLMGLRFLKSFDIGGFPSLTSLTLWYMVSLEDMCCSRPCLSLQKLKIEYSFKLTEIPSLPSLEELRLDGINHQLVSSVGRTQTSLKQLSLNEVDDFIYFPISILQNNSNLRKLSIGNCSKFQGLRVNKVQENENEITLLSPEFHSGSIHELRLWDCPVLKFLPDLRGWTTLQKLTIEKCPQVKESFTYDLRSLSFLKRLDVDFLRKNIISEDE